ncbi:MAG: S1 family peptidase, partial [Pseudonocardiaceae bacterium]
MFTGRPRWAAVAVAVGVGALTLAGSSAYADDPPEVFIVGGQQATEDMGWVAALHTDQSGFRCGAVLVAEDFLATNAHCLGTPPGQPPVDETYYARIGSLDRTSGGHVRRVIEVITHPEFDWHQPDPDNPTRPGGDVALLRLDQPVPEQPVSVAPVRASQPVRVTGWGF